MPRYTKQPVLLYSEIYPKKDWRVLQLQLIRIYVESLCET